MTLYTIASGSEGNCLLVCCGGTKVLIDAGISLKRIKAALSQLELTMDDIHAVLLTHAHTDHTAALGTLCKYHTTPLYTSVGAASQICDKFCAAQQQMHIVRANEAFTVGALTVTLFRFVCSFLSGVLLWDSYAPEGMNVWIYSLTYNGSYMIPNAILTTVLTVLLCLAVDPTTMRPMKRKTN